MVATHEAGIALIIRAKQADTTRPQKITLGEMREMGVRGLLLYCSDFSCSHSAEISANRWPDHVRLSDLETQFVCQACGIKGADLRPDFNWAKKQPLVPELTRSGNINLNERVSLHRACHDNTVC
jgi:hypothetical protein